jgi:hypothetical protein
MELLDPPGAKPDPDQGKILPVRIPLRLKPQGLTGPLALTLHQIGFPGKAGETPGPQFQEFLII